MTVRTLRTLISHCISFVCKAKKQVILGMSNNRKKASEVSEPTCPACGSPDLRHEADDRHQCRKCLWRCRIGTNGKARDWLSISEAGTSQARKRKRGAAG